MQQQLIGTAGDGINNRDLHQGAAGALNINGAGGAVAVGAAGGTEEATAGGSGGFGISDVGFLHGFVASLSVILVSEIGDKTFFIAAIMAMRHPRLIVFSGAIGALGLMTVLSAVFGIAATIIPRVYTYYISTALFAIFGLKMLRDGWRMSPTDAAEELEEVQSDLKKREDELLKTKKISSNVVTVEMSAAATSTASDRSGTAEPLLHGGGGGGGRSGSSVGSMTKSTNSLASNGLKRQAPAERLARSVDHLPASESIELKRLNGGNAAGAAADPETLSMTGSTTSVRRRRAAAALGGFDMTRVLMQAFTMTFLAEWGDRSQLTTIILSATENVLGVIVGGVLGHSFCTGLAVIGGRMIAQRISVRTGEWTSELINQFEKILICYYYPSMHSYTDRRCGVFVVCTECSDLWPWRGRETECLN